MFIRCVFCVNVVRSIERIEGDCCVFIVFVFLCLFVCFLLYVKGSLCINRLKVILLVCFEMCGCYFKFVG